ncbi:MAG: hypothetical protein JNL67_07190 [Planctomycetaceae bacterium]|nr:hypothetical protein [Planctomycetaceae bacterium]
MMHDYSMRGHPRERLVFLLAAAAFSLMPLATTLQGWLGVGVALSSFTLFSGLFVLFDRYLWRIGFLRRLFGLPDLNGRWSCVGAQIDTCGNKIKEWNATITIKQTWSRLSIALHNDSSRSRSGPASIESDEGHGYRLLYTYNNEPMPGDKALTPHRGACELIFNIECSSADGVYFNDHNRQSFGRMKLTKIA